jgi:hypothetical protein
MRKETAKGLRKEGRDILAEVGELLSRPLSACGDLRTFAAFFLARTKVQRWLFLSRSRHLAVLSRSAVKPQAPMLSTRT